MVIYSDICGGVVLSPLSNFFLIFKMASKMASNMVVPKPNIRKFPLLQCFLPLIKVTLRSIGCTVAMVITILISLSLKEVVGAYNCHKFQEHVYHSTC